MKYLKNRRIVYYSILSLFVLLCGVILLTGKSRQKTKEEIVKHRLQWWLSAIHWDEERTEETGEGIRVAILDSGVDRNHPDIQKSLENEYRVPGISKNISNDTLHGTAVAGIIAGNPSTDKGILGVAKNAKIISVDVTDQKSGMIAVENLVEGIKYAISQKVDIINISAGVRHDSDELRSTIQKAYHAGIVIVAASGNYMIDELLYPAAYDEVIAVGAKGKDNRIISPKEKNDKVTFDNLYSVVAATGLSDKAVKQLSVKIGVPSLSNNVIIDETRYSGSSYDTSGKLATSVTSKGAIDEYTVYPYNTGGLTVTTDFSNKYEKNWTFSSRKFQENGTYRVRPGILLKKTDGKDTAVTGFVSVDTFQVTGGVRTYTIRDAVKCSIKFKNHLEV